LTKLYLYKKLDISEFQFLHTIRAKGY